MTNMVSAWLKGRPIPDGTATEGKLVRPTQALIKDSESTASIDHVARLKDPCRYFPIVDQNRWKRG